MHDPTLLDFVVICFETCRKSCKIHLGSWWFYLHSRGFERMAGHWAWYFTADKCEAWTRKSCPQPRSSFCHLRYATALNNLSCFLSWYYILFILPEKRSHCFAYLLYLNWQPHNIVILLYLHWQNILILFYRKRSSIEMMWDCILAVLRSWDRQDPSLPPFCLVLI